MNEFLSYLDSLGVRLWVDEVDSTLPQEARLRYKAPKGTLTPELLAQLRSRKAEIITFLHKKNPASSSIVQPIEKVSRNRDLPLSFAEERLWFLQQLNPFDYSYNAFKCFRLTGTLNVAMLRQSLNEIIRRHESLRTTFAVVNGSAVRSIAPNLSVTLPVVDLLDRPEDEQFDRVQWLAQQEVQRPFDLANGSLLRATVLRLSEQSYVLLIVMHHIITDGWSMEIFFKELGVLYQAFTRCEPNPLPYLTIQYADFALWQRQCLTGELLERQLDYWKQQLADVPPLLDLPTDYPRPPVQTFRGATREFQLNPHLTEQLITLSQKSGVTLFMTLLAAFAILLHRYSSVDDICIGSPFANRNRKEIEPLIGFFVNTLVLRTQLKGNPSFSEFLIHVRSVVIEAHAHQYVQFEQVVDALQPERSLGYNPLFQVMFTLQNLSQEIFELPGITITPELVKRGTAQFDLILSIGETQKGLIGSWEYNSDLFEPDTIARMTGHFQTLLEAIIANPDQRVRELPFLTESERCQLLVEWNNTTKEYPLDKCIHELFEEQVDRSPDAIAVILEGEQLSYRELNQRANRIAHHLRALGVGPEVLVGICVERSPLMVVGLLGILKAGGAYVPLDPAYPGERLAYMLSDSQVQVLLTQEKLASSLLVSAARVIYLDSDWPNISVHSEDNPLTEVKPSNLAYVIYTSGSTGKPKGVMIEHRSIVNFTSEARAIYNITQSDRVLQFASIAFDAAVIEIFPCLSAGATLVLRTDEMLVSGSRFVQRCGEWGITMMDWPTSHWHQVMVELAAAQQTLPESLRVVSVGGEAVLPETLKLWQRCVKGLANPPQLLNGYGPTETTAVATYYDLSEFIVKNPAASCVPIGTPIGNLTTYVLNHRLQPVPIGVPGELHIGGLGLARGYLGRPETTAEKFIPNPFSNEPSARLYKTGDLVRYLSDGSIDFLGRIDNQVKVRGFRIELGEIEAVLTSHPQVEEAVVIVREDTPNNKRLVAYVVDREQSSIKNQLRDFLKQKLPNYMMPSAFVFLDALPLTPNGKVDRRALPAPNTEPHDSTNIVPPRDTVEQQLQRIWAEVLQLPTVGVQDNFFELGGHSLLAVRLMATIEQHFGKNLPLATLFSSSTIEQLAFRLRQETDSLPWSPLVAIQSGGDKQPFFCIPGVGGNVIYLYELARHLGLRQPFYGLQALGLDGESQPYNRVEDIAAYYIQAIQTVQPEGPYFLGGHSFGGQVAFEMATQLQLLGHSVALLAIIDAVEPILSKKLINIDVDDTALMTDFARFIEYTFSLNLEVSKKTLAGLTSEEQLNYLKERLIRVNLLPLDAEIRSVRGLVQVYKAHNQAYRVYLPQQVQLPQIALFRAGEVDVPNGATLSQTQVLKEPALGWNKFSANVEVHVMTGNHMTMMQQPHVQMLAAQLRTSLEQAQAHSD